MKSKPMDSIKYLLQL